jgi:hypothetical protein
MTDEPVSKMPDPKYARVDVKALAERLRAIVAGPLMEKHRVTIRQAAAALEASIQSGSAGEVEPVAWRIFDKEEDEWWTTTIENLAQSWSKSTVVEPLFATPAKAAGGYARDAVFEIEHDGFRGNPIGEYLTREGKAGVVLQQIGTKVVHVYGEKWLKPSPDGERQEGGAE